MRFAVALVTVLSLASPAAAQVLSPRDDKGRPPYTPGLGEIMTLQQMRHLKLWFAGQARNWELAAYQLDELKEGFEDVAKYFPIKDDVPLAMMVAAIADKEVPALEKAIAEHDPKGFAAAFDTLTQACNGCHQAGKHGFIVIRRPAENPYANQVFAPQSK